jgi:rod shape determining protein RodA
LLLVLLFGKEVNGTTGWFQIGNRSFQPAEVSKVTIIIVLAREFALRTEGRAQGISTFRELFPFLWRLAIPVALILMQPDWGTAFVYIFMFAGMLFMARTSLKLIGWLALGVGIAIPCSWLVMADYQKDRILVFLDPELDTQGRGMNVARAKEVIQMGGMNGKGVFSEELLTPDGYVPMKDTDFIFSATGEAVGFWGCVIVLLLYLLLLGRMVMLAMRAKDDFGAYMIIGITCMFLFHIFENIGMNIGVMPVTGIPLPLFSYGGSNMITTLASIGIVLNVNMRRMRYSV